ncbi:amidohydrolase 2 : Amidohydrolase 2 OS=Cyclobacterium marinum (strain ATCC 25205 / DSM 745) GN=Cycma_1926 PE=4 SV=1: Amidohydro_2 [Gemmata massiliana]|uniref:Amidohydrolase-related domain-containing protein n=1 Tax=Gemmata massiliana TaxID=1210884 RepID=A0A6P2CVY6_9BACT|nr:amidohydrolase family protein [Gemmata massiliana]VTR91262.1 amidohydrolase 2 : Amidohydrolase 2 OS=Cyclobacterium marinum (strain ATCC 25205 / DSM 745) GN=Cycma_1926 PE=4 SV=1: Amidohydro_2 [Gemmata massiliana]
MSVTRREFVASALALPLANNARSGETKHPVVVDTHLHCFAGKGDPKFPYHKDGPYQPADPATPEHLLKCMAEAGVDYAIIVHPEPYQDDHRYLEHCLTIGKGKLKGTCLFFAGREGSAEKLKELAKKVPLVAGRIHAYNPDRLPPFGKPELTALWKQIAELGLAVQLHFEPKYAEGFESLIKEFKSTRVLIDHLGRPFQGAAKEYERVLSWAKYANVVMKLSSVPDKKAYPHRDPQPVVKQLTEEFGADRLMFGGGYNEKATGKSYRAERERVAGLLAHLSDADRAKIFGGTAAKLFKLG